MAKKVKPIITKTPKDLAAALGLDPANAVEWEVRHSLTGRIIDMVKKDNLTVSSVARNANTSRARVTNVLKGDSQGISIDVLLRILGALGQSVTLQYKKAA